MSNNCMKKYKVYQPRRTWLLATTFFVSSGLAVIDHQRSYVAQADRVTQSTEVGPVVDGHEKVPPNDGGVTEKTGQGQIEAVATQTSIETVQQGVESPNNSRVARSTDQHSVTNGQPIASAGEHDQQAETDSKQSVAKGTDAGTAAKQGNEATTTNLPLNSLYDQTALSYERLVNQLGSHDANLSPKGDATLTSDKRYIAQPGQMIFGEPDKRLFGIAGTKNDYSNVSEMRLVVDNAFSKKVADKVKSLVVTDDKGSETHYYQSQNTLSLGGGVPFTANIYSSNDSALNPLYYFKMLRSTIDSVANIISIGMIEDKMSANYQQGQYGIYLRVAVPKGVDPNQFIQTLNLDNSRFAAEMNFNATIGLDRLINQIPGLGNLLSKGLGVPVSGNIGGVVDLVLGKTIEQLNQKYGTNLTARNSDSPFYPITLYPQATKVNLAEDPYGAYLLVRGDDLSHYNSAILQAKILLTKFFMESLSWAGNIQGGAYGYLNFDLNRYPGNLSSAEMKELYNQDGQHATLVKDMVDYADDSPYKVLTKYHLPPQPNGHAFLSLNTMDADNMLSRFSHDYGKEGDLGEDIALRRGSQHEHPLALSRVNTWRAYISLFDQQKVLNTKPVAGHSEEWVEALGQDHVLAGRDLDHRMVVLADGENFYDQLDRFDRVIDYFDHSVLLDGQGQHPSQAVKSVRLVRSVDPAGHKTSREDFAIYNRPFTVYYQGEMTLADGQVIPLRPTQLKVLQKNQSVASNVDQAKTDAFQIIQNQGDYIKQIIQRLQPKLLDSDIASYGQKIDEIVVETNQKLNLADDSTAIQQVQKEQSTRLLLLQNEAGQGRDLAIAILNASRDHGYQQLEQKALEVTVAVDDAIELSPQQKLLLKKRIVTIVDNGKQQIGQATDAGQAEKALQQSIQDLQKLFLSQNSKDEALATLQQDGDEKKAGFAQIDLVDADSLVKRQQEVDRLVKRYQATVSRVKTSAELSKVLTEGLQEINRVKNPVLQAAYRPATTEDKALAKQAIATKAEAKKKDFTHLDHVDQTSLKQQLTVVDQMLSEANQGIDRSKTQGEVLHQLQDGLANIDGLANPDLQKDYRAVTEEDKQSAAKVIDQAGSDRQKLLNQTQHADENSLAIQTALVEQAVSQAKLAIREAQIKKDLREAINQGQAAVYAVALPDLQRDYQMASQTSKDQAQAELRRAGLDRQTDFQQIIGVDPESLSKQSQLVDQAVAKAINAVSQADTYQNLDDAVATGLAAINQVDEPSIREELQAPSTAEIAQAKKIIEAAAALKENRFNKIAHVDGASLSQQLASIQAVVDKAHQAIDQSKTKGQVVLAMKGSLNQLTSITEPKLERAYQLVTAQDKLIANQKLAQQASAKKAAFADISHVDPISLVRQQLIVDQALTAAQRAVNQNVIQADLTEALDHGMTAIEAVTEPTVLRDFQSTTAADFEQSDQILRGAAEKKKQHFAAIVHVDATSLKEQVAVVDRLLKNSQFQVRQTKLISQFNAALQQGLVALDQVSDPILEFDYQPVTNDDREMALGMVDRIGQYKKDAIHVVNHADAASLKQQEAAVEIAISQAKEQVKQAKNQGELKKAMDDGIAQIDSVADPVIQEAFQPISQAEKDQTEGIIDDLYKGKVTDFRAIDHVDKNSLAQQLALLLQIKTNGQQALLISQNKGELAAALKKILEQMQQVAEPVKAIDYQQPNPSDVADAQRLLQVAVEKKRLSFANLIGVDPSSLAQQNQQLDQALQIAIASVALAKTNQELKDAYQNGLTVVNEVAAPVVQEPFQPVSGADREKAAKAIALIVDRQKEAFRTINHVDPSSLQKQIDQLNAIERQAQQDLAGIQVKGELNQLVLAVMDKVAVVSNPTLLANYQPVSEADKDQAIQSLTQLAAQQKRDFAAISHVDGQSLKEQNQALDQALAAGQGGIQASQNQGELNAAFLSAVQAIQLVSSPAILADFQPADEKGHWLAKQQIENALTTREQAFNQIDHVDDASLAKQVQSLNQAGQTAFDNLAKARTVGDLRLALAAGIAAILQVPNPVVQADYQPATAAEIAAGQAEIQTAADQRKQAFQAVAGVDMTELVQQEAELQKILNEGLVMAAVTPNRHDLQQVVAYYKAKIGAVTLPKALWIFRTPSADDKQAAKSQVRLASFAKHTHFDRIDGADVSSLILQRVAVNQAVQQSYNQIDQSTMNLGALAAANQGVTAIEAVADPDLFRIAEPADDTTAVAGKVVVEPAAKSLISDSTKLKDLDFDEVKVPRSQKTDASVEDQNDVTVTKIVLPETYNGQPKAVVSQVDQAVALQTDSSVKQQLPGTDHAIRGAWWRLMTVLLLSWLVVVVFGQKLYQKLQKKFQ